MIQRKLLNVRFIVTGTPGSHEQQNAVLWFFNRISTTLSDLAIKFVRHKFLGTAGLLDLFFAPVPVFRYFYNEKDPDPRGLKTYGSGF